MAKQRDSKAAGGKPDSKAASGKPHSKEAGKKSGRVSWFDDKSQMSRIEEYAQQLDSFVKAVADGKVTEGEVKAQEASLVALMKEVEPLLDDALHEKVTRLLCELTAYDLMQTLYHMRPPARQFRG
jgi:hypothetical protein